MTLSITSTAFGPGQPIPERHTGEGEDRSPPLAWSGLPEGTKELALICDDPDAPRPTPWVHWVLCKLPPTLAGLEEGDSGGGVEGRNDSEGKGWSGPLPPRGHGVHHYHFKLYALDALLDARRVGTKDQLLAAMNGHILDEGELVGTYERK